MIGPPSGTLIWLVAGFTDLRRGFEGLCAMVQNLKRLIFLLYRWLAVWRLNKRP